MISWLLAKKNGDSLSPFWERNGPLYVQTSFITTAACFKHSPLHTRLTQIHIKSFIYYIYIEFEQTDGLLWNYSYSCGPMFMNCQIFVRGDIISCCITIHGNSLHCSRSRNVNSWVKVTPEINEHWSSTNKSTISVLKIWNENFTYILWLYWQRF